MLLFFIGILAIIAGVVLLVVTDEMKAVAVATLVVGVLVTIFSFFGIIPTGYTGIVTTFGKVHNDTLDAGIYAKAPWDSVITMDNREQRVEYELGAFSSDIQEVQVKGSVTLNIDKGTAMTLYKDVGTKYMDVLVKPRIQEDVKAVFAAYTAEELISNRNSLSAEILAKLANDLNARGLNIISVAVEDIDFTDAFTNAVEAKQVASQELQKARTMQEQQTMEAQQAAERKKIHAQAEADVAKIDADANAYTIRTKADAEAEANKLIAESITADLINYTQIQRWNGSLPTVYGGPDMLPVLNMGVE